MAQDPVKVAPKAFKVLLENDRVRVLDYRAKPGEKEPMHSHPDSFIFSLSPYKIKINFPDGTTEMRKGKAGEAIWQEAETHSSENMGTADARALIVELKEPKMMKPRRRK
ncbi:MAG: cytoplasmic protein [Thermodesulfobacteriota bacterium]